MGLADIAIPAALFLALVLGIIAGARMTAPRMAVVRTIVIVAVLVFLAIMIVAAFVAGYDASETVQVRLIIFWIAAACLVPPAFGLGAAVALLCRSGLRRSGVILTMLSLTPLPVFLLVVIVRRALTGTP